ncbi:(p)ppGpp synthetase I, SpoT/RelA [Petrotoga mobilis SJ95]|jgi:GTP pyrophosphokinase|uniref:(P)ppGpp synthetase I, SpoT/RelA n=1 Tax=Petrotoga mobilis (strain DSM 10674 / SJ95) TaxID=403833 RepID=A9BIE8_PETMO|nr:MULTISPECIES: bifunctional (p)ppGpp synthetase/guanosine-3',5'-bis(diphosphate) 3'-pyrophosphohydrolase [Petrotoga]ABX32620.1 (p)ppGpp synthetase I, SpoT/RelA [Petrotoga mobilis SJ95]PNR93807.1 (p)ppGpp synthetase [Petrotoga sp. HWHPT.55.6.3]
MLIESKSYEKEVEKLLNVKLTKKEKERIKIAYELAETSHSGQFRDSGEEFFEHPKSVGLILAGLKMDVDTIIAGLLHDVVEDCGVSIDKIKDLFGIDVANIVSGVTKISNLKLNERLNENDMKSLEKVETIRKMLFAMSEDIRVIIVKLADRLHNMRTLEFVDRKKQIAKADETLKIYAPIAHRLGIYKMKEELEDLSFRYLYPETYFDLKTKIEEKIRLGQNRLNEYAQIIKQELDNQKIKATVEGRSKHLYSIWDKMIRKGKTLDEIYDYIALRIITEDQNKCYAVLGIIHSIWSPVPGRIKDYIATPKFNGYKSLHTTVITHKGDPLEIQIRDWEMHEEAEYGLAAHWVYKEGVSQEKLKFLTDLMELHRYIAQNAFELKDIETNLLSKETFVFTPKGEIIHLPRGATPIDFAFAIHTEVGNHFSGAKVNGKLVPISYKLQTGDIVEILINRNFQGPSIDWLKYAHSPKTISKIKKYYRQKNEVELIERGKDKFRELSKKLNFSMDEILEKLKEIGFYIKYNIKSDDEFFIKLSLEDISINTIRNIFTLNEKEEETITTVEKTNSSRKGISVLVDGEEGVESYFAKCCMPVPGDEIIGVITRRGIGIHRKDCNNIQDIDDSKKVNVEWNELNQNKFSTVLMIDVESKNVLNNVRNVINNEGGHIEKFEMTNNSNYLNIRIYLAVQNLKHLSLLSNKLKNSKGVYSVRRV